MDILLFATSIFIALCIMVTAIASIVFIAFAVLMFQEWFRRPKIRSLIMSDYVTSEKRLAV